MASVEFKKIEIYIYNSKIIYVQLCPYAIRPLIFFIVINNKSVMQLKHLLHNLMFEMGKVGLLNTSVK